MMLWLVLALMTALALALLLPALLRHGEKTQTRAEYDRRIYRDQLAEVERDAARGLIDPGQAASARAEIGRRLLAADSAAQRESASPERPRPRSRLAALTVLLVVPASAFGLYLLLGSPQLALHAPASQAAGDDGRSIEALVSELGERLKSRPDDAVGWALYARSLAGMGRLAEAEPAFVRARALDPGNADLAARHAEATILAAEGNVTAEARAILDAAIALDPREPRARYYLALAERQAGRPREALARWLSLEADSPTDAAWRAPLGQRIDEAAKAAGIDAVALAEMRKSAAQAAPPLPSDTPARGPGAADMEAAARMSPEERQQMIRGMVEGLAQRLAAVPDDFEGWLRLGRAYAVLREPEKSRDAFRRAAALRAGDADGLSRTMEAMADAAASEPTMPAEIGAVAERVLALDPKRPSALWYAGLARQAAGDTAGARRHWEHLLAALNPADPRHAELKKRLDALGSPPPPR